MRNFMYRINNAELNRIYFWILFLDESDIRGDIMFKTDVTQALLMLIFGKSPTHVLKRT